MSKNVSMFGLSRYNRSAGRNGVKLEWRGLKVCLAVILAKRRDAGLAKQTNNHYRQAMHQFCRWLCKRSLINANPIAEVPKLNVDTDRRHDRRAISVDEFQRLIIAAEGGKSVQAIDRDRSSDHLHHRSVTAAHRWLRMARMGSLCQKTTKRQSRRLQSARAISPKKVRTWRHMTEHVMHQKEYTGSNGFRESSLSRSQHCRWD